MAPVIEPFATLEQLGLATGLGLLIGLERERAGKETGLRTFALVAMAGAVTAQLSVQFAMITLGFVSLLVLIFTLGSLLQRHGPEMTTAAALFVAALAGILVGRGYVFTPVTMTIFALLLLAWKEEMVGITRLLRTEEVHAGITLGLLALVILPSLPNHAVDPWALVNPRKVWIMVVMISAIGFANYVLLRLYGARGVNYTGFLGGLVNSTAAVGELAQQARGNPELTEYSFRAIMLAKTAMFLRNGLILGLFAPRALPVGILPVTLMLCVTVGLALYSRAKVAGPPPHIKVSSPFSLSGALNFGFVFLILTVVAGLGQRFGGNLGFWAVTFLGGLVSSSSTAATAANLVSQGAIPPATGGLGVVLTSIASAIVLLPIVWRITPNLARRMAVASALAILAAIVGWRLNPWFLSWVAR
ncbi:MAG: MgtC/SapB family protein [Mycobacterium leprae]